MPDEWEQYAVKPGAAKSGDEWEQYAVKPKSAPIQGLAPGQSLPGIHAPKVNMKEVANPVMEAGKSFAQGLNPINTIKGIGDSAKQFLTDPLGTERNQQAVDFYIKAHNNGVPMMEAATLGHSTPGTTAENINDASKLIGRTAGNAVQSYALGKLGSAAAGRIKAPIAERLAGEESRLDQAGIVPSGQTVMNKLDSVRNRNLTSQGVPIDNAMENAYQGVEDQLHGIYTNPHQPAKFSDVSQLKSGLQTQAGKNFFDTGDVVSSKAAKGEASRAVRGALRETPGAEDWATLQDEAARGHRIDNIAGRVGGAIGAVASPILGLTRGHKIMGALGMPVGATLGYELGSGLSHAFTSGAATNAIKPILPAAATLPLTLNRQKDNDQN